MTSIAQAILDAALKLRQAGVPEARREAGSLMAYALDRDRTFVLAHADDMISVDEASRFREAVEARMGGKPLQYITGRQEFYGLEFEVNPDVLIPRPETELLIENALKLLDGFSTEPFICDVGTGSGCLAITLLRELRQFPNSRAVAIDISPGALVVAKRNAAQHSVSARIEFVLSDCFAELRSGDQFHLIVSNPPYVSETAIEGLQREVRDFEPRLALTAGADGLTVVRRLLVEAVKFLKPGGYLLFEIGFDQGEKVQALIDRKVWTLLDIYPDLQGIPRLVALRKV
jgi:release factor glutamine methyltransferase